MQQPLIPVVGEMIRSTPGCISLGQGVVWWGPPPEALSAVDDFLEDSANHKYHLVQGIPALHEVIGRKLSVENRVGLDGRAVIVTAGGNMAFSHAVKAIADPGDEIILQTPYYFNHEMAVAMAGCRAVLAPTVSAYQLQPEAIDSAVTSQTRAVVTVSPNNPTGAVYSESALRDVNEICRQRGIYHIHDEAYEYFVYNGAAHFSPASIPGSEPYTISIYSLSKAYGLASWRVGYMVIPEQLSMPVKKIQDTTLICAPAISQYAAAGAMRAGVEYCRTNLAETSDVREQFLGAFTDLEGLVQAPESEGAFYFLLKLDSQIDGMQAVERLIRDYGIGVMPGSTFGADSGCSLRVSYGPLRRDTAGNAIDRLISGIRGIIAS